MEWLVGLLAAGGGAVATILILVISLVFTFLILGATLLPLIAIFAMLPKLIEQARREEEARLRMWNEVAHELGGRLERKEIHAAVDGRGLRVVKRVESNGNNSTSTYTDVHVGGLHPSLKLEAQNLFSGMFGGTDHEVGDADFDGALVVGGDEAVIGLLDARTRELLRRCPYRLRVRRETLRLTTSGAVRDGENLRNQITWARELAAALSATPDGLVARLARGAIEDPHPGVRRRFLEVLRDRQPASARTAAQGVLQDPDPGVRVIAAQVLGRGDLLLDVLVDPASSEETRLLALASLPPDAVEEGIRRVVAIGDAGRLWRGAALAAPTAGTPGAARALAGLAPVLAPDAWPRDSSARGLRTVVAREVARALGTLPGDAAAEALLCTLLTVDDSTTREAAVASLGAVGTVAAVPALSKVVDQAGILTGHGGEARKAIRTIQARAGGERGAVALAADGGGGLAVAEDDQQAERARLAARRSAGRQQS